MCSVETIKYVKTSCMTQQKIYKSLPKSHCWPWREVTKSYWRALTDCSQTACQTATPYLLSVFPASVSGLQSAAQTHRLPFPTPSFAMMDRAWSYPPLLLPCPLSTAEFLKVEEGREVRKARKSSRSRAERKKRKKNLKSRGGKKKRSYFKKMSCFVFLHVSSSSRWVRAQGHPWSSSLET